jgi:predicted Holliday junction resolvase-like endonuclease
MNDILQTFQSFKRILCVCPCCGELMRLSDLHLRYTGKAPKTWLDKYEHRLSLLEKREERFDEKEREIRQKSVERGRKKVPSLIKKCICPEFTKLSYDPYDIKAIMHPVDFVVFDGLNNKKNVENVILLSRKPVDKEQDKILNSIMKTVEKENFDWKVARISIDGDVEFDKK